jgi:dipeptidyl aminopeptidase/acylaminoacyl peptidase
MNLATGAYLDPVHTDREFDLSEAGLVFSRRSRELVGFHHARQRSQSLWFSPVFAELQQTLDQKFPPEEDHRIVDFNDAEDRFLIKSTGPRQPGVFYLHDLKTKKFSRLGEVAPALLDKPLRPTQTVAFKARDGLALEALLTLPAGVSREHPAPLVVLPHGGPQARDGWHFDPEVQFLATRGYAVLQPNYRGSSGYLWPEDADGYWNAFPAMRDDVIDATRTALRTGLFDPARVAIMGSSFGGYLSIAAPVEEPDLFRCAVTFCGVFDWAGHVKSKRSSRVGRPGEHAYLSSVLGDPKKDQTAYEALSPLGRIDRLRIPVLIAHGREDHIVSVKQSRLLARELKKRRIPHETFYRSLAGHGFYAAKDRLAFYETLERFLAENLATPAPAAKP